LCISLFSLFPFFLNFPFFFFKFCDHFLFQIYGYLILEYKS
jgi:hypothetical protein